MIWFTITGVTWSYTRAMPFIFRPSRARRATSGIPSSVSHVLGGDNLRGR